MNVHSPQPSDGELVQQALSGRSAAYAELARRWAAPVLAVCHARIRCWHTAEDLAQETLLRGLAGLATLSDRERFGPWLRGIAQRTCLDWLKRKESGQTPFAAWGEAPPDVPARDPSPSARMEADEELRQLLACVEELDEDCREVLLLYYYQERTTYAELAALLEVSSATINARLTKARATLRNRLMNHRSPASNGTHDRLRSSTERVQA